MNQFINFQKKYLKLSNQTWKMHKLKVSTKTQCAQIKVFLIKTTCAWLKLEGDINKKKVENM